MKRKHFHLVTDICRCAMGNNPNSAVTHQIDRLRIQLAADGFMDESIRLGELLQPPTDADNNFKFVRSNPNPTQQALIITCDICNAKGSGHVPTCPNNDIAERMRIRATNFLIWVLKRPGYEYKTPREHYEGYLATLTK